jgi:hypothetical protein
MATKSALQRSGRHGSAGFRGQSSFFAYWMLNFPNLLAACQRRRAMA